MSSRAMFIRFYRLRSDDKPLKHAATKVLKRVPVEKTGQDASDKESRRGTQVHLNLGEIVSLVSAIGAFIGAGFPSLHHIYESWSPSPRYRELRLLRNRDSKAEEMNSASSDRTKEGFASFVNDDDCKIEQYRFARELKNPRKNFKQGEESASLPDASLLEYSIMLVLILAFLEGCVVLFHWLKSKTLFLFVLSVLLLFCLLFLVWALLIRATRNYVWNATIKDGFNNFLMPVFQETEVRNDTQDAFNKAVTSFHNVNDDDTILSLKKACSRILKLDTAALVFFVIIDTVLSACGHPLKPLWYYLIAIAVQVSSFFVFLCCYSAYFSELQKLIHKEKKGYPWYNPLIDANNERHFRMLNSMRRIGYWFGKTINKTKA